MHACGWVGGWVGGVGRGARRLQPEEVGGALLEVVHGVVGARADVDVEPAGAAPHAQPIEEHLVGCRGPRVWATVLRLGVGWGWGRARRAE